MVEYGEYVGLDVHREANSVSMALHREGPGGTA